MRTIPQKFNIILTCTAAMALLWGCAGNHLGKGLDAKENLAYASAIDHLEKALEKDSTNATTIIALAESYRSVNDYKNAVTLYSRAVKLPESKPEHRLQYARMLMALNRHEEAGNMIRLYLKDRPDDTMAKSLLESCSYIELFLEDSSRYRITPIPLLSNVSMMVPVKHGNGIVFAAERNEGTANPWTGLSYYDLYFSEVIEGEWQPQKLFGDEMAGRFHEGPVTLNGAGDLGIVTRSTYKSGRKLATNNEDVNHFGLYEIRMNEGKWTHPEPLPFNNENYSVGHASLSPDGQKVFFTSDMPGGFGGSDLYFAERAGDQWSNPINLGPTINTEGNEVFPVYTNDSTLHFSSDGQPSLGGLDIFRTVKTAEGWSTPVNLNYPLNSTADDFGILFEPGDSIGFLSSNRLGNDRIFRFSKTPVRITVNGRSIEKETGSGIAGVTVKLINLTDGTEKTVTTNSDGNFDFALLPEKEYRIEGYKEGYFRQSKDFNTLGKNRPETIDLVFEMEKLIVSDEKEHYYTVDNIYYDYDAYEIRSDAARELDKLVKLLKDNPGLVIELHSHTDSRGAHYYNDGLSEKRAKAAVQYIISKGIEKDRLGYKGLGKRKPVINCPEETSCTEEQHQKNRRTEFIVLGFKN